MLQSSLFWKYNLSPLKTTNTDCWNSRWLLELGFPTTWPEVVAILTGQRNVTFPRCSISSRPPLMRLQVALCIMQAPPHCLPNNWSVDLDPRHSNVWVVHIPPDLATTKDIQRRRLGIGTPQPLAPLPANTPRTPHVNPLTSRGYQPQEI